MKKLQAIGQNDRDKLRAFMAETLGEDFLIKLKQLIEHYGESSIRFTRESLGRGFSREIGTVDIQSVRELISGYVVIVLNSLSRSGSPRSEIIQAEINEAKAGFDKMLKVHEKLIQKEPDPKNMNFVFKDFR